jgi:type IV pilus assembly protein PilO
VILAEKKNRTLLWAALGCAILGLITFLMYNQVIAFKAARDMAATEQAAVESARARLQELTRVKERSAGLQEQLALYNKILPAEPAEDMLITEINNIAQKSGMHFLQVRFEQRVKKQDYVEMPFRITFEGRYHALLDLLADLQDGPRALRIDNIKIGKGREELPQIKAEIAASAFYSEPQPPGKAGEVK